MSPQAGPPVDGDNLEASLDAELGRVLEAYLADLQAGRPVDPDKLLAEHPALAEQLWSCLAVVHMADRVADASASASAAVSGCALPRRDTSVSSTSQSALTTLGLGADELPQVHLRDEPDEREPLVKPRSDTMPLLPQAGFARYQLQGEIARGGMGAVLKGRDVDLGRDLAIKVLLESHQGNAEVVRRFVEEAQIGGQLQHPGVVPVYELGTFPDRRPFFAMKLVKGQTLASLLHERTGPAQDLPRFLAIFEAVCQTMAYAHARGVIHRDLKPSNVMVGSFGEVQVMDWGLAKVLPQGGVADEAAARPAQETVITTVRSGSAGTGSESQAGSVLGTPSYMAPEQARGEVDRIDERADVFGLGAILCEILTGRPPFAGSTREEIRAQAARGDLTDAVVRLEASGAEIELVALAEACLAAEPERRPRNAGAVVQRVTAYLAGVQERLKAAELARVEAQTRAEEEIKRRAVADELAKEERKRRRMAVALAASVLVTAGLVGGGWAYLAKQWQERTTRVTVALGEVEVLRTEAERAGDDLARWHTARDAAHAVEGLLADAPDELTRRRGTALVRDVTESAAAAENDQKLLTTLVDIRSARADDPDRSAADVAYADAFREAGIDIAALSPAEAGTKIQARPTSTRLALAAALDDWAAVRRGRPGKQADARRLTEAARLADPDPWRNRLRELLQTSSSPERLTSVKDLAKSARFEELPAVSLLLLGSTLVDTGDLTGGWAVFRDGQRLYPGDVWLNYALARCLEGLARREEAIRYYMAARSLRPETSHLLANALEAKGETDQAIAIFQDLARLRPKDGRHLAALGIALTSRGRTEEAKAALEAAVAAARAAIELKPGVWAHHTTLGFALSHQGKPSEAIAAFHEALRLKPDDLEARGNLGAALREEGKLDEAIAECRETIRLKPDLAPSHANLGNALFNQGKLEEAITACREALRLKSDFSEAHKILGTALHNQGKLDEAIAEFRAALRIKFDDVQAHTNVGAILSKQGKLEEAIAELREALRFKPDLPAAHMNLGISLGMEGKLEEAIAELREALRLKPDQAEAHYNLGLALANQGKLDEAIAEYRAALRLKPDFIEAHTNFGNALRLKGALDEAIAKHREVIRLKPDSTDAHNNLGNALIDQGKPAEAIAEYREALRLKPDSTEPHNNLGNALRDQGDLREAIAEFRVAIRLKPDYPTAHYNFGIALVMQGKLEEAIAEYRTALRLKPDHAEAHCNLGHVLRAQGRFVEALAELKRGHELGSKNPNWHDPSAEWVRETERLVELDRKLPAILVGNARPSDALETLGFAQVCYAKKLHGPSARFWAEAFQAQPMLAEDMQVGNRYNAACAAALAGSGQGKDDPPLDDGTKARWRKQSVDWLKADLTAWSKVLDSGPPQARQRIPKTLQHWKADTDLAGLRGAAALAKLPGNEQKACRALWTEVDLLLAKAQATNPGHGH